MTQSTRNKRSVVAAWLGRTTAIIGTLSLLPSIAFGAMVIEGVTVVDTQTGDRSPNMSIVIDNDLISQVGPLADIMPAAGDAVVDGTGLFIVPGYNDMHTHALTAGDAGTNLRVMLANGITGFRQMSSTPEILARLAAEGSVTGSGPALLAIPGAILNDGNVRTAEQVAAEIHSQKEAGADFIKILVDNPLVYMAALDAAQAEGIPIAGHFPPTISAEAAAEHGMDSMEHLGPRETLLLSASSREDEFRTLIANAPSPPPPSAPPTPEFYARVIANPIPFTSPAQFERMFAMAETYDVGKARALARVLKTHAVWQVPTLIRLQTMNHGDDPLFANDPNLEFVTEQERGLWQAIAAGYAASIPEGAKERLDDLYATQMALTRLMAEEGVPMLAGSDYGGQWLVAGFSLHQEFAELAKAGLTPLEILQMTTLNAAAFLGHEDRMGRVASGMPADLVLLSADPIADSANLDQIEGVINAGTYYDRNALDAMLGR